MSYKQQLSGVFAPITTPFHKDGALDLDALRRNMEYYAASPIQGYLALGSNGENKSLIGDEKFQVLKIIIENKSKKQCVMAGCIAESMMETVGLAKRAESLGADFITLLAPSYFKSQMTDEALERYFTDVADSVSAPCLLYCAPQFSGGTTLSAGLVTKAARHANIVGMKDSSTGNIDDYLQAAPDDFAVMAGSANFYTNALLSGATGGVISLANVFPHITGELYAAYAARDYDTMFALDKKVKRLNKAIGGKGGVPAVKAAMNMAGLAGGYPRLPLLPLKRQDADALAKLLKEEKLI